MLQGLSQSNRFRYKGNNLGYYIRKTRLMSSFFGEEAKSFNCQFFGTFSPRHRGLRFTGRAKSRDSEIPPTEELNGSGEAEALLQDSYIISTVDGMRA